jgi:septum site-determining protein MinC
VVVPAAVPTPAPETAKVIPVPTDPSTFHNNALYMRQTIRSGQSVRHDGTIIICGDVNAGAEVIATGDIIVFGTLRGVAHAGATGDEDAQIIAINLRPTQIRIAGYIARSPDTAAPPLSKFPEVARVQNSEIHIIPLRDMNPI